MSDIRDAQMVAKTTDGRLVQRPLSPHLAIYRWPVTMLASILNRATGVALSAGSLLLVWWLVAAAAGPREFATVQGFIASPLGLLMLLGWTASLFYHLFSGIRHLAWDMVYGFAKPSLNPVTYMVIALAVLATILVWVVGYLAMGALSDGNGKIGPAQNRRAPKPARAGRAAWDPPRRARIIGKPNG